MSTTVGIYNYPVYSTLQAPSVKVSNLRLTPQEITDPVSLQIQAPQFYIKRNIDPSDTKMEYVNGVTKLNTNFIVDGYLSKQAGTFNIEHPDPQMAAAGYRLRHSFVEAPTRGENIYRSTAQTVNGMAIVLLPSYFASLNESPQAWVQPHSFSPARATVSPDRTHLTVYTLEDCTVDVLVIGTRTDPAAVRGFDNRGGVYFSR